MKNRINNRVKVIAASVFLSLCLVGGAGLLSSSLAADLDVGSSANTPSVVSSNQDSSPDLSNNQNSIAATNDVGNGAVEHNGSPQLGATSASQPDSTPTADIPNNPSNNGTPDSNQNNQDNIHSLGRIDDKPYIIENSISVDVPTLTNDYERDVYVTYQVDKKWNDIYDSTPVTIRLFADGKEVEKVVLSKDNGWKSSFNKYPKYIDGKKVNYTIKEDYLPGYNTNYSNNGEITTKTHWLMVNAPEYLSQGKKEFALAIQDWFVALPSTYNWQDKYYLLVADENGNLSKVEIHANERFEHLDYYNSSFKFTNEDYFVFQHNGKNVIEALNGMNPDSKSDIWVLEDGNKLKNQNTGTYLTLKGIPYPFGQKVYSFVLSNKDGWDNNERVNYSNILNFENVNAFMSTISSEQLWGVPGGGLQSGGQQYIYLDWGHILKATNQIFAAGQFKFFTPVDEQIVRVVVANEKIYFPQVPPPTTDNPPVTPDSPPPTTDNPPVTPDSPPTTPPTPEQPPVTPQVPSEPQKTPDSPAVKTYKTAYVVKKSSNDAPKTYDSGILFELGAIISSATLLIAIRRFKTKENI